MTTNTLSDWPDDPDDQDDDLDDFDDLFDDELDDELGDDDLAIDFLVDRQTGRVSNVFTKGLWELGLPELCVTPPAEADFRIDRETGNLAILLALGLYYLGSELIAVDHFDIPPYLGQLDGVPVQLWLSKQEPVNGRLALALGDDVDTIFRVDCSLWQPPPPSPSPSQPTCGCR